MKQAIYNCQGFEWDEGNSEKNWLLHEVTDGECEEVFFNLPLLVAPDVKHSQRERRYFALGRTEVDRWLFVDFIIHKNHIRVISARDMNQRETRKYAEQVKRFADLYE